MDGPPRPATLLRDGNILWSFGKVAPAMPERSGHAVAQVVGAACVVTSVVISNAMETVGVRSKAATLAVVTLFVAGWASFAGGAAMLSSGEVRRLAIVGTSATIAVSSFLLRRDLRAGRAPTVVGLLGFFAGWIGLALVMGSARGRYAQPLAGAAAAAGGMALLPWQRRVCAADGPAMPLFTLGWVLIATALR